MQMEPVDSSLISHRGYDPDKQLLLIRFTNKTMKFGSLYEYGGISETFYAQACAHISDRTGEPSFGQFFQKFIKPNDREYPCRKLEDPHNGDGFLDPQPTQLPLRDTLQAAVDFESGAPLPATTPNPAPPLIPETPRIQAALQSIRDLREAASIGDVRQEMAEAEAELKAAQEEALQAEFDRIKAQLATVGAVQGNRIVIASPEAAALALTTGNMIARWRDDLEKTMRPEIERLRAPYTAALAIFNRYNNPLKVDQDLLRESIAAYNRDQKRIEAEEAQRVRRKQEEEAEKAATERARDLQIHDAVTAEARGETEVAEQIIASKPLPMAPVLPPPMRPASVVPEPVRKAGRVKYAWEMVDPNLIPDEYWIVDTKAIDKLVDAIGERANTALNGGIRAYDAGTVAFSKKKV